MKILFALGGFRISAVLALTASAFGSASGQQNTAPEQLGGAKEIQPGFGEARKVQVGDLYDRLYGQKVNEQELTPSPAPVAVKKLLSDQLQDRLQGLETLHQDRTKVSESLIRNIERLATNPSRSLEGRFNLHLVAVGRWRIKEAIPLLVPMIDFTLDPETFPVGVFSPMFYPVAQTLVDIGGRDVAVAVIDLLSEPADSHRLFVSGWVLQGVLGREAAKAVVVHAMQGENISPRHQENLFRTEKLLSKEHLYLKGRFPGEIREHLPRLFEGE